MKLSMDNLLSYDNLNSSISGGGTSTNVGSSGVNNLSYTDSPHNNYRNSNTPSSILNAKNNLVSSEYDSPCYSATGGSTSTNNAGSRLSTDRLLNNNTSSRNNMSNNNLSTSASLLDATTDDAMSSNFLF